MKEIQTMTAKELAKLIIDHKEDIIEFAIRNNDYPALPENSTCCEEWWFAKIILFPEYQSNNLFIDFCGGGYGILYSYDDSEFTIDNLAKSLRKWMVKMKEDVDYNQHNEPIVYVDITPYQKTDCIESCPHCGKEIEINWCVKEDGYEIYCPYCGKKIMLCDECMEKQGDGIKICDWTNNKGCFRQNKGGK